MSPLENSEHKHAKRGLLQTKQGQLAWRIVAAGRRLTRIHIYRFIAAAVMQLICVGVPFVLLLPRAVSNPIWLLPLGIGGVILFMLCVPFSELIVQMWAMRGVPHNHWHVSQSVAWVLQDPTSESLRHAKNSDSDLHPDSHDPSLFEAVESIVREHTEEGAR